jgi:hypothetical protein
MRGALLKTRTTGGQESGGWVATIPDHPDPQKSVYPNLTAALTMHPTYHLATKNGELIQLWVSDDRGYSEWRRIPERNDVGVSR